MKTSKAHVEYWRNAIRKQKLSRKEWERSGRTRNWEAYVQFRGRREWFNLGTPAKEAAATKARDLFLFLRVSGWDDTLRRYKPEMFRALEQPTLGEYLASVSQSVNIRPSTLKSYEGKLRNLVAGISDLDEVKGRFDARSGGNRAWRDTVDAIRLSKITVPAVNAWKKATLAKAEDSPVARARACRTINSTLRNSKSLFTKRILAQLPFKLSEPLPFDGVDFEKVSKPRYKSRIDGLALLEAARGELKDSLPELYKIVLLALCLGLRRREIDGLEWSQFDFAKSVLRVETNHYTDLKTDASEAEIDMNPVLCEELKQFRETSFSTFVISAPVMNRKVQPWDYRCDALFQDLVSWLRNHGVTDDKPLHTLRKEFGSTINAKYGIYAASVALRHSSLAVTRDHYVDKKQPICFPMERTKGAV
jgi:integrase